MAAHVVEHPEHGVKCLHNLRIPMEDGIRLAADLYAPLDAALDGSRPLPVVMEYIPYRKDDVGVPDARTGTATCPATATSCCASTAAGPEPRRA